METANEKSPNAPAAMARGELLPCPFCNSQPHVLGIYTYRIKCGVCGVETAKYDTGASARAAWNRRASPVTPGAEKAEPVATLHGDGYWTWKQGTAPYESHFAGWRMDVYAAPTVPADTAKAVGDAGAHTCPPPRIGFFVGCAECHRIFHRHSQAGVGAPEKASDSRRSDAVPESAPPARDAGMVKDALSDPLCCFKFADAALRVLIYEIGQFGTIWNSRDLARQSEIKAAIANAIEEAALRQRGESAVEKPISDGDPWDAEGAVKQPDPPRETAPPE